VTEIGENTFADCSKLETVIVFRDTPLPVDEDIFKGVPLSEATLRVPSGTEDLYRAAPVWKDFGRIISAG
jgi:hypothetical protein